MMYALTYDVFLYFLYIFLIISIVCNGVHDDWEFYYVYALI